MRPELAHLCLWIAWASAVAGLLPFKWQLPHPLIALRAVAGFTLISTGLLLSTFLQHDFSVLIIAEHVQSQLPWYYKIGALWGGHEGSMLLWVSLLSVWGLGYSFVSLPEPMRTRSAWYLLWVFVGLLSFILMASSPFARLLPLPPLEGRDLNPLLQDMGMMNHPPLLYLGYVGFAIPYAMMLAGLNVGERGPLFWSVLQRCVLIAWGFLTVGITLGSFWAYYELGWGGFWFWDPVENASLVPWLLASALLHALLQRDEKKAAWLSIWTFVFSLLGTFLVRSGLLTSVHSFASDPARGFFILGLVAAAACGGQWIYLRYSVSVPETSGRWNVRQYFLNAQTWIFIAIAATVFLGTAYPLVVEALNQGFISVGPQYFNRLLVPAVWGVVLLMGASVFASGSRIPSAWQRSAAVGAVAALVASFWAVPFAAQAMFAVLLWLVGQAGWECWQQRGLSLRRIAMHVAHMGFVVMLLGIALSQTQGEQRDVVLAVGDQMTLGKATLTIDAFKATRGPNFEGMQAQVDWQQGQSGEVILTPEKRFYTFRGMAVTETAILPTWGGDYYIALGEPLVQDQEWSFRVQYKPFIRLIWIGGLIMALGMWLGSRR